jgi:predicted phage terminase large subunit-like protein
MSQLERKEKQELLLLDAELKKRRSRKKILDFTTYTKPDYEVNWHHERLCEFIDEFLADPTFNRAMVFMPPRHGKSEIVSRRLPAFVHGINPDAEIMLSTYNSDLAGDMSTDVQRIIDSPRYAELFPRSQITKEGKLSKYTRSKLEYELIPIQEMGKEPFYPKGSFRAQGVGGSYTGRGSNLTIIDDPYRGRTDSDSKNYREMLYKFYTSTLYTRLERGGKILITLTRWHADDIAAHLLALAKADPHADQWRVLSLPAIRENTANPLDPRKLGDPLWVGKYDAPVLAKIKSSIGSRDWSSLYQQRPTAEGGNIIQSEWIKYYKVLPQRFDQVIQSWDFAVKDKSGSDYTACQVWGRIKADKYLIYQFRARVSFPVACQKVVEISKMFPQAHKKLIEAKANGPAIVQTLKKVIPGLVEVEPYGDKISRVNSIAPQYESGNVYYPVSSIAPWIDDHVTELCDFPNGAHDDTVDCASQALNELKKAQVIYMPIAGHSDMIY